MSPRSRVGKASRSASFSFSKLDLDQKLALLMKITRLMERQILYLRSCRRRAPPNSELARYLKRHERIKALCVTL
jgi:hypothetical protein